MVEKIDIKCSECKGNTMFIDTTNGEIVCKNCGTVQNFIWWKDEIYE